MNAHNAKRGNEKAGLRTVDRDDPENNTTRCWRKKKHVTLCEHSTYVMIPRSFIRTKTVDFN